MAWKRETTRFYDIYYYVFLCERVGKDYMKCCIFPFLQLYRHLKMFCLSEIWPMDKCSRIFSDTNGTYINVRIPCRLSQVFAVV